MKKITLFILAAVAMVFAGCKNYDSDIDDINARLAKLEAWQESVNTNISSLQTIVTALQGKDYVTSVVALSDGSGYQITFDKSGTITIKNGVDGKDGVTPVIGVKKDTDGYYYWTVNTGSGVTFLKDADGNMIRTTGDTPKMKISEDGYWYVAADGVNFVTTGVKAQGDAVFAKNGVTVGNTSVTFTLAGGTTFSVPLYQALKIAEDITDDIIMVGDTTTLSITLPAGLKKTDFSSILAKVECITGAGTDLQTRSDATADAWGVKLVMPTYQSDGTCNADAKVMVIVPTKIIQDNATGLLEVILSMKDGVAVTASRTISMALSYNDIGAGTEASPYLLYNVTQLQSLATAVNGGNGMANTYFKMMKDIDLSPVCYKVDGTAAGDKSWTPIGYSHIFNGIFDGNSHQVKNLYINAPGNDDQGLFGYLEIGSAVKSLSVSGSVTGQNFVGGITGYISIGTISACSSSVEVKGEKVIGGIAGYNSGTVSGCSNTGAVSGNITVGGVAGYNTDGTIACCYNRGAVSATDYYAGGVAGYLNSGTIAGCYNTGTISGSSSSSIGGILGEYIAGTLVGNFYLQGKASYGIGRNSSDTNASPVKDVNAFINVIGTWKPVTAGATTLNNGIYIYNTGNYLDIYGKTQKVAGSDHECKYHFEVDSKTTNGGYPVIVAGEPK
jgi:hypothetical protein